MAFCGPFAQAQTPTVSTVARLGGTPDGSHPFNGLIAGADGSFYGTTEAGGAANCGTAFRLSSDGVLTTLHAFTGGDGANPQAALIDGGDGFFYGTTQGGGANGTGTIFQLSPVGGFTNLHSFDAVNAQTGNANSEGAFPQAALVSGNDGYFYGAAFAGGASGNGTVFRVAASGVFNVVHPFGPSVEGVNPVFALTPGGDGYLYGTTSSGGAGSGVVFKVSSAGDYQVVAAYPAATGSRLGAASPLVLSGGQFYGLGQGSSGSSSDQFYAITSTGALTTLHAFSNTEGALASGGPSYRSGLSLGTDGNFYAAAPRGGTNNDGAVLRLTPAGALTTLHAFDGTDGLYPTGAPLLASDGSVYGVTAGTLTARFGNGGTVYKLGSAGDVTTLQAFKTGGSSGSAALLQAADGDFYGVTSGGGAQNGGTIFAVSANGASSAILHDFDPDTEGSQPRGALVQSDDGTFYGTATGRGPGGGGTLFKLSGATGTSVAARRGTLATGPKPQFAPALAFALVAIYETANGGLGAAVGANPIGLLAFDSSPPTLRRTQSVGSAPTFYGITQIGGDGNGGSVFSLAPGASSPASVHSFGLTEGDGKLAEGLVEGRDLALYGTTYGGGNAGVGTVFRVATDGTYTRLYSFRGAGDGAFPLAGLTVGTDGNLYGTTSVTSYDAGSFNQSGSGTIFKVTPDGTFTTLHVLSDNAYAEGYQPMAALVQASDGKLYGTTSSAGPGGYGTVFSITPGGTFATVGGFTGLQGGGTSPRAPLIQAADGNLYGVTSSGGTDNAGVVFKVALAGGSVHPAFFSGEAALANGVYYLQFAGGNPFGYYSYLADAHYFFHFDLGYEYVFDAADGKAGVYLYDFASNGFFYTSPGFPFPYLYDFSRNSVLYYYPDPANPGHYNTNGVRYFYDFGTGGIITK